MLKLVIKRPDGSMTGFEAVRVATIYPKGTDTAKPELVFHLETGEMINVSLDSFESAIIRGR